MSSNLHKLHKVAKKFYASNNRFNKKPSKSNSGRRSGSSDRKLGSKNAEKNYSSGYSRDEESRYIENKRKREESPAPDESKKGLETLYMSPDRSLGDLYCKVCDAHMNSEAMWESHIQGKRHMKNMSKDPNEQPSKIKVLDGKEGEEAFIQKEMEQFKSPVVGLDHISEIRKNDPVLGPTYICYVCSVHQPSKVALKEHIHTVKHLLAYVKLKVPDDHALIEKMNMTKHDLDSVARSRALELEKLHGRGFIKVKYEKPKPVVPIPKKKTQENPDDPDSREPQLSNEVKQLEEKLAMFEQENVILRHEQQSLKHKVERLAVPVVPPIPQNVAAPVRSIRVITPPPIISSARAPPFNAPPTRAPPLSAPPPIPSSLMSTPKSSFSMSPPPPAPNMQRSAQPSASATKPNDPKSMDDEGSEIFAYQLFSMDVTMLMELVTSRMKCLQMQNESEVNAVINLCKMVQSVLIYHKLKKLTPQEKQQIIGCMKLNKLEDTELILKQLVPNVDIKPLLLKFIEMEVKREQSMYATPDSNRQAEQNSQGSSSMYATPEREWRPVQNSRGSSSFFEPSSVSSHYNSQAQSTNEPLHLPVFRSDVASCSPSFITPSGGGVATTSYVSPSGGGVATTSYVSPSGASYGTNADFYSSEPRSRNQSIPGIDGVHQTSPGTLYPPASTNTPTFSTYDSTFQSWSTTSGGGSAPAGRFEQTGQSENPTQKLLASWHSACTTGYIPYG